jgi:hypothetical protein
VSGQGSRRTRHIASQAGFTDSHESRHAQQAEVTPPPPGPFASREGAGPSARPRRVGGRPGSQVLVRPFGGMGGAKNRTTGTVQAAPDRALTRPKVAERDCGTGDLERPKPSQTGRHGVAAYAPPPRHSVSRLCRQQMMWLKMASIYCDRAIVLSSCSE